MNSDVTTREQCLREIERLTKERDAWMTRAMKLAIELAIELQDAKKSQGYSPKPHWESHWDLGSMEEV